VALLGLVQLVHVHQQCDESLEKEVAGRMGILLNNKRFCIGPDARLHM